MLGDRPAVLTTVRLCVSAAFMLLYAPTDPRLFLAGVVLLGIVLALDPFSPASTDDERTQKRLILGALNTTVALTLVARGELNPALGTLVALREMMAFSVHVIRAPAPLRRKRLVAWLTVAHYAGLRLWLLTYLAADGVALVWRSVSLVFPGFQWAQGALGASALALAYAMLGRSMTLAWNTAPVVTNRLPVGNEL